MTSLCTTDSSQSASTGSLSDLKDACDCCLFLEEKKKKATRVSIYNVQIRRELSFVECDPMSASCFLFMLLGGFRSQKMLLDVTDA